MLSDVAQNCKLPDLSQLNIPCNNNNNMASNSSNKEEIDEPSTAKIRKSPRYKTAYINRYEEAIDITIE